MISKVLLSPAGLLGVSLGSDASAVADLISHLASSAPSISFTAVARRADSNIGFPQNVRLIPVDTGIVGTGLVSQTLRGYRVSLRLLETQRPDLIHHIWPLSPIIGFDGLAVSGKLSGTPMIIGPVMASSYVTRDLTKDHFLRETPLALLYRTTLGIARLPLQALFRQTLRECEVLVAVNTYTKNIFSQFISPRKIRVIPWGVDSNFFGFAPPSDNRKVVFLGALWYRKGCHELLEAFVRVITRVPGARLDIIGIGPQKENLVRMAKRLKILDHVTFNDFVPPGDLPTLLHRAQVFCLPTLHEAFGRALIEAMSCGLPCISTLATGPQEIVANGESGFLIEPGDISALADHLINLLTDYNLSKVMGAAGRQIVLEKFDGDIVAQKYLDIYSQVVGGSI